MAYWGNDQGWRSLPAVDRAAVMALMEARNNRGRPDIESAKNALGVMINRAAKEKADLGDHVSSRVYQPTIEPAQYARLEKLLNSPEHQQLKELAARRLSGQEADWVQGATHFLAPESQMLALEAKEPNKYKSWRKWTGFDPETNSYKGVMFRDSSHAFLAPEGAYSAGFNGADGVSQPARTNLAQVNTQAPVQTARSSEGADMQPIFRQPPQGQNQQMQGGLLSGLFGLPGGGQDDLSQSQGILQAVNQNGFQGLQDSLKLRGQDQSLQSVSALADDPNSQRSMLSDTRLPPLDMTRLASVLRGRQMRV